MVATHAAYESSKLDSLRRPALAPLNALCTALATTLRRSRNADIAAIAGGYLEHHGRDAGAVVGATTYVRASPMGPVPDVTAALELALAGVGTETWAGLVPPAVAAEMAEMARGGRVTQKRRKESPETAHAYPDASSGPPTSSRSSLARPNPPARPPPEMTRRRHPGAGRRARDDSRGIRRRRARARPERVGFDPSRRASAV